MISLLPSWSLNKNKLYWEEKHRILKNHNIPISDHLNEQRPGMDSKDLKNPQLKLSVQGNPQFTLL